MTSIVSICNLALSNIGKENISDIDEVSTEAKACRQFYAITRDMLLQSDYPWRFARKIDALAETTNDLVNRWGYSYRRPLDCLKIRRIFNDIAPVAGSYTDPLVRDALAYDVIGSTIYCSVSPVFLEYTARKEDPTVYPPLFVDALGWHLAVRLAMPLTRDPKMRNDAYRLAQAVQKQAEAADANEVAETSDYPSEFIEARSGFDLSKTTHPGFRPS